MWFARGPQGAEQRGISSTVPGTCNRRAVGMAHPIPARVVILNRAIAGEGLHRPPTPTSLQCAGSLGGESGCHTTSPHHERMTSRPFHTPPSARARSALARHRQWKAIHSRERLRRGRALDFHHPTSAASAPSDSSMSWGQKENYDTRADI